MVLRRLFLIDTDACLKKKMVRAKELTSEKRAQITILCKEKQTSRTIAKKHSVSQTAVVKTIKRYQEQNDFRLRARSG